MKIFKRIILGILALLVILILVTIIFLQKIKTQAVPDYNVDIQISGLNAEVEVFRDKQGIPHIYAESEADLYRAVGYIMAEERLWQMDLLRRVTMGRLSEIFGADMIPSDLVLRALQMPQKSKMVLDSTDKDVLEAIGHFVEGVNQYIESHQNKLPPEFVILGYKPEPWKIEHSANLIGYMGWDLMHGWSEDLLLSDLAAQLDSAHLWTIVPDIKNQPLSVFPGFDLQREALKESMLAATEKLQELGIEIFNASNNWAVSGSKSETGMPLLANDMHLGLNAPGIWMQIHQEVKGKVNVTGVALPGQPFIICGHNDSIAWGMTNVAVDNLDFYQEKINEERDKYFFNGEWKPLRIENLNIKTKEGEIVEKTLRFTHRGPLVSELKKIEGKQISMRWAGNDPSNELLTVYLLNRANNWSDFRNAVKHFKAISQNIVYADVKGNIGLQCSAGIPVRKGDGFSIHSGETDEYDWAGYVPFEELPYEYNPERGYVSSANNKTVSDDYPYFISYWFSAPYRITRIREMLEAKEKLSVSDFKAIQTDRKSKLAETYLPLFVPAIEKGKLESDQEKESLTLLKEWDVYLGRESAAATIFETLYMNLIRNMIDDELDKNTVDRVMGNQTMCQHLIVSCVRSKGNVWFDNIKTEEEETFEDIVLETFKETVLELTEKIGQVPAEWEWQKVHKLTLRHPLGKVKILDKVFGFNTDTYPVPGSFHTVGPYSYSYYNPYESDHGASERHVFDLSDWDCSETVIPTGNSGIPASPYYCNQTEMYVNDKYHDDYFSKGQVMKNAVYKMKFLP